MKALKVKFKTDKEIENDIDACLSGRDKSQRGTMLRSAAKALSLMKTKEEIRQLFIDEYKKKYGDLYSGKKSLEQIKQESLEDAKKAKEAGLI